MILSTRIGPTPSVTPETEQYWQAATEGRLLLRKCVDCGEAHYYPRSLCPFCMGQTDWIVAAGTGSIYSFSVMTKVEQPYAVAYVKLDEGPVMMTNIIGTPVGDIEIGARVTLEFIETEGVNPPLPMFRVLG